MARRQDVLQQDSISKQEMYSEQRSMMRHTKMEQSRQSSSHTAEAQEWMSMIKSEARKSAVTYANASHFDMVSTFFAEVNIVLYIFLLSKT